MNVARCMCGAQAKHSALTLPHAERMRGRGHHACQLGCGRQPAIGPSPATEEGRGGGRSETQGSIASKGLHPNPPPLTEVFAEEGSRGQCSEGSRWRCVGLCFPPLWPSPATEEGQGGGAWSCGGRAAGVIVGSGAGIPPLPFETVF